VRIAEESESLLLAARCTLEQGILPFLLFLAFLLLESAMLAAGQQPGRVDHFEPCRRSSALSQHGHMDLGVRISTANPVLATEFERALDFWADVLDMTWHEDNTTGCAIQLIDGGPDFFRDGTFGKAQLPWAKDFEGWVAFDPRAPLTKKEMYHGAVHEIGHLLGLRHNPRANSVMCGEDNDEPESLEITDLNALARRHKLRRAGILQRVSLSASGI